MLISNSRLRTAAVAAVLSLAAGAAQAAITVLGGGYAQSCSRAARDGDWTLNAEQTCTFALDYESLGLRDRAGTFVNRGVMKLRRAEYVAAMQDFDAASQLSPTMGEAHINRGAALIGLRRYADSLPSLNRGLELGVDEMAKAYYNRAMAYEGLDDPRAAYLDYQKAQELEPAWPEPARQLARFQVTRAP